MNSLQRFYYLMLQILIFSFIYMLLNDAHFSGINTLEEMIRDELLQRKIDPIIKEEFKDNLEKEIKEIEEEIDIDTDPVITEVTQPTLFSSFFKRLYFSFVTGSTLGYGDIFPNTVLCKTITIVQLITSILLLVI
ncbi:MAG: hypothetical protein CML47_10680 [Rhodobacteraceae bacterium]|nr:MAG: hypothetical protein CML47_10680 [Paracoccaceae bacterium]